MIPLFIRYQIYLNKQILKNNWGMIKKNRSILQAVSATGEVVFKFYVYNSNTIVIPHAYAKFKNYIKNRAKGLLIENIKVEIDKLWALNKKELSASVILTSPHITEINTIVYNINIVSQINKIKKLNTLSDILSIYNLEYL